MGQRPIARNQMLSKEFEHHSANTVIEAEPFFPVELPPPAIMLVLSGAAVALKWSEEINYFVLIFVSLTTLFYVCMLPFIITKKLSDK